MENKIKLSESQKDALEKIRGNNCKGLYIEPKYNWFTLIDRWITINTTTAKALIKKGIISNENSDNKDHYLLTDLGRSINLND